MNEQAAHLVDRVLPKAPYRQFVLTLPGELARMVAFDTALATAVFGVFADEVARWQCAVASAAGIDRPEAGSVLEIQRFADGARLFPHAHALVPEGVFYETTDPPSADAHGEASRSSVRFHRLPPPTDEDIEAVVLAIEHRMKRVLDRWRAAGAGAKLESLALLAQCATASPSELTRIQGPPTPEPDRAKRRYKPLCARSPGGLDACGQPGSARPSGIRSTLTCSSPPTIAPPWSASVVTWQDPRSLRTACRGGATASSSWT